MGWIGRGRILPELESTAFALVPGEVSETVRSRLGYHILKVTDRDAPDFSERGNDYRDQMVESKASRLEEAYIDSIFGAAEVKFRPDAIALVRELAGSAQLERVGSARRARPLVTYRGGSLTLGEWADFTVRGGQDVRRVFASPDSARVQFFLQELVRNELLVKAAADMGIALSEEEIDSLTYTAKRELTGVAVLARLRRIQLVAGDLTVSEAVDRIMVEFVRGQRSPEDIDSWSATLRHGRNAQVYPDRFPAVLDRLTALRRAAQENPSPAAPAAESQPESG
jgi:hypothetical protein